jgi:multidrug resistance efflux pump
MSAQVKSFAPSQAAASTQGLLTLIQFARRVREADTIEELAFIAVNETHSLLEYRQAALWLADDVRGVISVSGVAQLDTSAPYIQWLNRLFRSQRATGVEPKHLCSSDIAADIGEEWGQWLPRTAWVIPLVRQGSDTNPVVYGALLLARDQNWQADENELGSEVGRILGHSVFAFRPRDAVATRLRDMLRSRRWLWRAALVVLALLCLPVRLSVLMQAEITPLDAFVVRAPLDGVVDRFQVRPNEVVTEGAPLFNLDTTALQSRHATAREAYETAREEYRQSAQLAVVDDKAKLEVAVHKGTLDQKAVELAYSASQLDRVQVKAARAGVVVFSDVHEWLGRVVSIGEKVLVLADPNNVELTARMPVGDQIAVEPGAEIIFHPDGSPFSAFTAVVDSVAYRAEPNEDNVLTYRIRAHFKDTTDRPRLGLMGSARVYGGRVPLVYTILRRPLTVVRQWFGW